MAFVTVWTLRPPDRIVNTGPREFSWTARAGSAVNSRLPSRVGAGSEIVRPHGAADGGCPAKIRAAAPV